MASGDLIEQEQTRAAIEFLSTAMVELSTPRDLPALAHALAAVSGRLVATEYFSVYFVDHETGELLLPFAKGFSDEEKKEALRTAWDRHPGRVIRAGEMLHVPDVQADGYRATQDSRRSFTVRSRLWMPVAHGGIVVGAIGLASMQTHAYSPLHVMVLGFTCQIAGVMYKNITDDQVMQRQLDLVQRQGQDLRRLSSPILEVGRRVLAVPLIGRMDPSRFTLIAERLLPTIVDKRARAVILDMTGVDSMDAGAVGQLVQLRGAVELLGCACSLSGISPEIARQLSETEGAVGPGRIYRTLEQALSLMLRAESTAAQGRGLVGA